MATVEELDAKSVYALKIPHQFLEYLGEHKIETVGDLRKVFPKLEADPPKGIGYGKAFRRMLEVRFSRQIFCWNCDHAMWLYRSTKSCPNGCGGVIPIERNSELHTAFPDLRVQSAVDTKFG